MTCINEEPKLISVPQISLTYIFLNLLFSENLGITAAEWSFVIPILKIAHTI